jgi:hypothetical protein
LRIESIIWCTVVSAGPGLPAAAAILGAAPFNTIAATTNAARATIEIDFGVANRKTASLTFEIACPMYQHNRRLGNSSED